MSERDTGLFALVVTRPVAITMIFLSTVVFGWVSYNRLPISLMPDISYPTLTVRTTFEGAAPQEVETQISRPVEEALATLDGLVSMESHSRAGQSDVVLGFDWGTDMAGASQTVREALQTTFLPDEADRPLLLRYDPSAEPFLRLGLSYDPDALNVEPEAALMLLRGLADREIKRALEGMDGVAAVRVRGGFEREIRVEVREDWLAARQLTLDQVRAALAAENVNLAGGSIYEGDIEYLVRTLNEYRTMDELRALRIRRADGALVPITDVALLSETHKERTVLSHLEGAEAVELEVYKEADANVVEIAGAIAALIGEPDAAPDAEPEGDPEAEPEEADDGKEESLSDLLPDGVTLAILDNQASFIEMAIDNLVESVLIGGALSILVLFLFLREWRSTLIIGVTIPVSLIMGFAPLYLWGVSLNVMSLGGLALGISMLVDNAVVVLENIQRHQQGMDTRAAAIRGTSEVALAMFASTMTSVAVFAPIAFVEGVAGELFGDLALAVVGAQLAGLATGLLMVPMLAALDLGGAPATSAMPKWATVRGRRVRRRRVARPRRGPAAVVALSTARGFARRMAPARAAWRRSMAWAVGWRRVVVPYLAARHAGTWLAQAAIHATAWALPRAARWGTWLALWVVTPVVRGLDLAAWAFQGAFNAFAGVYARAIRRILTRPALVLVVAAVAFLVAIRGLGAVGSELIPEVHQGRFTIEAALPIGTPVAVTAEVIAAAEARVAAHPEVQSVFTTIGAEARADTRADEGEHTARLRVQIGPGGDLARREERIMADLRDDLADLPRLDVRFSRPALFSFRTPLEVVVFGQDLDRLRVRGEEVAAALAARPGLADVHTSLTEGNPEIQIAYDRGRLARFGLDTSTVADTVRDRVQGVKATEIHAGEERLDLRVQLTPSQRESVTDLRRLNVNPKVMPPIPLEAVASFTEAVGPSEIRRVDQRRAVVIGANLVGFDMGSAVAEVDAVMRRIPLADDEGWALGGQARDLSGSLGEIQFAAALAVFLVYVIMAMTFENLVQPFVILFSVPLGLIGVIGSLLGWGMPFSIVAGLGVIVLAGVVVNNAIVLIDAINQLRDEGMGPDEAVATAAATRLRPILITTSTAVLGLVPLLLGVGAGAEIQQPMAVTIVGGLSTSTLLTLVVIPAAYLLVTGRSRQVRP